MKSHELGKQGEALAQRYLADKGLTLIATNYYCRFGELDIVAKDKESIVFAEVKSRARETGFRQAVSPKKIKSLLLSARSFLQKYGMEKANYRFIVIYVLLPDGVDGSAIIETLEEPF